MPLCLPRWRDFEVFKFLGWQIYVFHIYAFDLVIIREVVKFLGFGVSRFRLVKTLKTFKYIKEPDLYPRVGGVGR